MEKINFEEGLKRLEEINTLMENDSVTLEEASNLYKEGRQLCDSLKKYIEEKELIIQKLDSNGNEE